MNENNRNMNVLHIFSGDLWAGAEVMIFNLIDKLKEGPDLRIFALSLNEGVLTQRLREAGVETRVISEKDNSFPDIFFSALNLLKKEKIDIIHSHRYKENLLALLLAKSLGVKKLITTVHGLAGVPVNGQGKMPVKSRIDSSIQRSFFSSVVAVSQELKENLIRYNQLDRGKVSVIHNGIPVPPADLPLSANDKKEVHIGTVGRMEPVKDFNLFLEIATEIKKTFKNVRFSILGDGAQKKQLLERSRSLGLSEFLEFPSLMRDPIPYYRSLDIYLNTSVHEGIPMSILEAMSIGKPVVAPRVGGIPEIISHGEDGFLVDGREANQFAHYCLELINDEHAMANISKNAIKKVRHSFSSSRMAESYKSLYEQDNSIFADLSHFLP